MTPSEPPTPGPKGRGLNPPASVLQGEDLARVPCVALWATEGSQVRGGGEGVKRARTDGQGRVRSTWRSDPSSTSRIRTWSVLIRAAKHAPESWPDRPTIQRAKHAPITPPNPRQMARLGGSDGARSTSACFGKR